jgi:hypothetical protein
MYSICSDAQATRDGPPASGLGKVLTKLHSQNIPGYGTLQSDSDLSSGRT